MKSRRRPVLLAAAVALVTAVTMVGVVIGASAATATACPTDRLAAGQHITARTTCWTLTSQGGHFWLSLGPNGFDIQQWLEPTAEPRGELSTITGPTWIEQPANGTYYRGVTLSMLRTGSLQLSTASGQVLWSTHTTGSGATTAVLRDSGRIVLYTASGKRVWASQSGIFALGQYDQVLPGHVLMQNYSYFSGKDSTLRNVSYIDMGTMQTDGDYVYRCRGHIMWHTNTHKAGSSLVMAGNGALQIRGPRGAVLWSTPTAGDRHAFSQLGTTVDDDNGPVWWAPMGTNAGC